MLDPKELAKKLALAKLANANPDEDTQEESLDMPEEDDGQLPPAPEHSDEEGKLDLPHLLKMLAMLKDVKSGKNPDDTFSEHMGDESQEDPAEEASETPEMEASEDQPEQKDSAPSLPPELIAKLLASLNQKK